MLTADFDVKIKLIILTSIAIVVLALIVGRLWIKAGHFTRYFSGVLAVIVVLCFILGSLLLIHQ
ncbi:hypothetical protein [Levilactobacillus suantsaii]|uniref:Uncharacterized protein n=1 Tax=Levilactobacillus suantsaii TaxID=2292255 RepID=A0A4Q0VJ52_9LACO|nr:hypothetical protein [Levilactobacillus suantsaii]QMU08632.1 hypothetical protein H3M12_02920 [Levilactobacillus suantsaii]RXI78557.1 hypothetical protein DXH47_06470 [Levilactobacillus suantsaii]